MFRSISFSVKEVAVGLIIAASLLTGANANAAGYDDKANFQFQPLFGYERVQRFTPVAETVSRFFYGARVIYGYQIIAAEAEYTRATDSTSQAGTSRAYTDDRLKVGARSAYRLGSLISFYLRAGLQGTRRSIDTTVGGVTTNDVQPAMFDPYAGTGVSFRLANNFSLDAGLTLVFQDFPDHLEKTDYQTNFGFTIRY